jgi:hypothetical protein
MIAMEQNDCDGMATTGRNALGTDYSFSHTNPPSPPINSKHSQYRAGKYKLTWESIG